MFSYCLCRDWDKAAPGVWVITVEEQFSNGDDSSPKSLQGIRDMSGDVFNHNWGISMPWVFTEMTGGKIFVFI